MSAYVLATKWDHENPNPSPWQLNPEPRFVTFEGALAYGEEEQAKPYGEGELDPDTPWIVVEVPD